MEYELGLKLTKEDLLGVMINRNDVRNILYSAVSVTMLILVSWAGLVGKYTLYSCKLSGPAL